jgi:arabinofuranosyltransferase
MVSFENPDWDTRRPVGPTRVLDTCGLMGEGGLDFGPHYYLLDECGLADPLLARLPAVFKEEWRPGHFRRFIPEGYRASVAAATNDIKDAQLRQFYVQLRRITRSKNLWSKERLWAIWMMNIGGYDRLVDRHYYRFSGFVKTLDELSDIKSPETAWDAPGNTILKQSLAVRVDDRTGRRYLDVSLEAGHAYTLLFVKYNAAVGKLTVGPIPAHRRKPGLVSYTVDVPSRAERGGFDTILVMRTGGDEASSLGHLLIEGNPKTDAVLRNLVAIRDGLVIR